MSIELDFIKRYGPPKYRIDHKLKFQDEELYIVQETPNTDLELMKERLKGDTFSRLTKLYPRQGPWVLPIKYKIVNNYPAFRRKSGKEVGTITERVYQPTHSHIQRSKGALDPDEQCPPHQKRMSYSATYLRRRAQSNLSPEGATARSITSCSRASKQNCKSRPKSCPPTSSKKNTESQQVKKKLENRKQYRRRSFFTFLDENFFSDQSQWDDESTKSYGSKSTFDLDGNNTESKNSLKKVTNNVVSTTSDDNSSRGSESWDDSFSTKSDYSADCSDTSSDDVDTNSYDSESRDSDMEQSGDLEISQESLQPVDNDTEKGADDSQTLHSSTSTHTPDSSTSTHTPDSSTLTHTPDSSTLTHTPDSSTLTHTPCSHTEDTSSDSEDTDDLSTTTEGNDESVTSVSQTARHSTEYSSANHSSKKISISFEDENADNKGRENSSDTKTTEDSADQVTEDDDQLDGTGTTLSENDDDMKDKIGSRIPSNAATSIKSGSQQSLILKDERSVNASSQSSLSSAVTEKSSGSRQSDGGSSRMSVRSNITNHSFKADGKNTTVSRTSKKSSSPKDALGSQTSMRSSGSNATRPNSRNMFEMSKSQTSLKSRVSQQSIRSRPGTRSSVKRSESRTSVKGSPYEAALLPYTVTRNKSHGSLKSTSSKVSVKSSKSTESRHSLTSSRKSSASFHSVGSQKRDASGTDSGFRIKVNENCSEAAVPDFEENEAKRDELDMSGFKNSTKEEYTSEYDLVHGNIKESEASVNQVGENNEVRNNGTGDDVEENLKRVRDLLEELKSPNHNERDETKGRANEQICEESSVETEKAHNSHPDDILLKDDEQSGAQSPTNSEQISEVNHSNDSQNSTNNNKEDVTNGNLSDSKRELCETDVDLRKEKALENEDTVDTFFT